MKDPALFIEVTRRCTNLCKYCGAWRYEGNAQTEWTPQQYRLLFQIVKHMKFPRLNFTGGEPTLRADLCEIISDAINIVGGDIHLTTNGTRILEQSSLWEIPISLVKININTLDKEIYNKITGVSQLDKVIKGIEYLMSRKIPLRLHSVISQESKPTIKELINFCNSNLIDLKLFQVDTSLSTNDKQKVDISDIEIYLNRLSTRHSVIETSGLPIQNYHMCQGNEVHIVKSGLQPYNTDICIGCASYPCDYGLYSLSIDPEGSAYTCLIKPDRKSEKLVLEDPTSVRETLTRLTQLITNARVINNELA